MRDLGRIGQLMLVVPSQRLVLLLVAMPDTDSDALHGGILDAFVDLTRPIWQPQ
jgi:hypothetical protein